MARFTAYHGAYALIALTALACIIALLLREPPVAPVVPEPVVEVPAASARTIGTSVEGRAIDAYTFGTGDTHLLLVGGIHGGYEWNSVVLAHEFIKHFTASPELIPSHLRVSIIPSLNPDGVSKVTGLEGVFAQTDVSELVPAAEGRFNANAVDLNRNFDCKWQPESTWRGNVVSAGTAPFSEPEAHALRDFVLAEQPEAVVFWHSQANAVYASECENGILPLTRTIMSAYAGAAGYASVDVFDAYPVTGDAEGWLASIGIPAITVELSSHSTVEWEKNLAGTQALFGVFAP